MKRRDVFKWIGLALLTPITAFSKSKEIQREIDQDILNRLHYDVMDADPIVSNILDVYTDEICSHVTPTRWNDVRKWLKYGDNNNPSILQEIAKEWNHKRLMEDALIIERTSKKKYTDNVESNLEDDIEYLNNKIEKYLLPIEGKRFLNKAWYYQMKYYDKI